MVVLGQKSVNAPYFAPKNCKKWRISAVFMCFCGDFFVFCGGFWWGGGAIYGLMIKNFNIFLYLFVY